MSTLLITSRLALAGVFMVAAIAKLADMTGSRHALEDFRVPARLVPAASVALPAVEMASALLLLVATTAQVGAALAATLLLTFVAGIVAALRRGAAPDCHCFGQLHSKPAGKETIGRNFVLAAVSLFVLVAGPGPGLSAWVSGSSAQLVALAGTSLFATGLAYAYVSLWRDNRELRGLGLRPDLPAPLEVGRTVPPFEVADTHGSAVTSSQLLSDKTRTIIVFTSATCGPCLGLLPELARWQGMLRGRLDIHVLASGDADENRRHSTERGISVLLDRDGRVAQVFGVVGTPSAVEIAATGRVESLPVAGAPAIEGVIRAALRRPSEATGLDVRQVNGKQHQSRTADAVP